MTHKSTITHPTSVVHDINIQPLEDIIYEYGIEINTDGSVWDPIEEKTFKTLMEWAVYMDELNNDELYDNYSKIGSKQWLDDD